MSTCDAATLLASAAASGFLNPSHENKLAILLQLLCGSVGGSSQAVIATPVLGTGAYAANDCVGGLIELSPFASRGNGAVLQSIHVYDTAGAAADLDFNFFGANPSASTLNNDVGLSIAAADVDKLIATVHADDGDYQAYDNGSGKVCPVRNLGIPMRNSEEGSVLYCAIMTTGTPTYGAANALKIVFGFLAD